MIPWFVNVYKTARSPKVLVDDPWGWGRSLEWATSCPPPPVHMPAPACFLVHGAAGPHGRPARVT